MDLLDLIIVGVVALGGWNGYRIGMFRQITRLFGVVIAYFVSLWLRPLITPAVASMLHGVHWSPPQTGMFSLFLGDLSGAVAFFAVFIVSFILLRYAAGLVDALFHLPVLSTLNRFGGLVVGLVFAMVFVYVAALAAHYITNDRVQTELNHSIIVTWLDTNPIGSQPGKGM